MALVACPRPVHLAAAVVLSFAILAHAEEGSQSIPVRSSIDRHVDEAARSSPAMPSSPPAAACLTLCESGCREVRAPDHREPGIDSWKARLLGGAGGLALGIAWGTAAGSHDDTLALSGWRGADAAVLGLAAGAWLAPRLFDRQSPELGRGRFSDCEGKEDRLWSVDRKVRRSLTGRASITERERAGRWSDATLGASLLYSFGLALAGDPPHRERDLLVTLGTLGVSLAVNDAVKNFFDRPRPYTHFCEPAHPGDLCARDAQLSFYSGHASTSFAAVVAAGRLARMHGYRNQTGIWATGLTLATATGVLRIRADKHYLTDVLVGALAGGLAGWLVPALHEPKPGSDPSPTGAPVSGPPALVGIAIPGQARGTGVLVQAGVADGVSLALAWRF